MTVNPKLYHKLEHSSRWSTSLALNARAIRVMAQNSDMVILSEQVAWGYSADSYFQFFMTIQRSSSNHLFADVSNCP